MPSETTGLSRPEAQLLMSRLLDGELSSEDAGRLHAYLEEHPDEIDWMESSQLLGDSAKPAAAADVPSNWEGIKNAIEKDRAKGKSTSKIARFPTLIQFLGAAAAVVLVGGLIWTNLPRGDTPERTERYAASQSVVEFIDTDIPDASPVVYTDEISGWTVVWVAEMEPMTDETG